MVPQPPRRSPRLALRASVPLVLAASLKKPTKLPRTKGRKAATARTTEPVSARADLPQPALPLTSITTSTLPPDKTWDAGHVLQHLCRNDANMASLVARIPRAKLTELMAPPKGTPFASLAKAIIFQQLHGKAATTIYNRFVALFQSTAHTDVAEAKEAIRSQDLSGDDFPTPGEVRAMPIDTLRSVGLSQRKASYILDLAHKFDTKAIDDEKLVTLDSVEISKLLCQVKGIGQWTADMFLIFYLKRLDVFPVLDLGVRRGMAVHFGLISAESLRRKGTKAKEPSHDELTKLAECWRPYRSIASWYMWQLLDTKTV
ncbi:hypothetical protein H4R34_004026 [Dimargaris verticillata]|uniref:HhH-GPD domain-containing protein n=1 Tax=Dimargaris verticillata TaxID=2761393 RepID=A0A9W8AYZ1_9FUNG|nr:hypothetical protein H4R34_004026 [Dimargaris verticillata]